MIISIRKVSKFKHVFKPILRYYKVLEKYASSGRTLPNVVYRNMVLHISLKARVLVLDQIR